MLRKWIFLMLVSIGMPAWGQSPNFLSMETDPIRNRLDHVNQESANVRKQARNIDARLDSMRDQFRSFGLSEANRLMLEETRQSLPSISFSQQQIAWVQRESRWLKLQILDGEQGLEAELHDAVSHVADHSRLPGESTALHEMHEYSTALGKLAADHQDLVDSVRSMQTFIDRQLLWVANVHPVAFSDVRQLAECTARLGNPEPWSGLVRRFSARIQSDPWQLGIVIVLVIASGVMAHRLGGDGDNPDDDQADDDKADKKRRRQSPGQDLGFNHDK